MTKSKTTNSTKINATSYKKASFLQRAGATIIDLIILVVLLQLLSTVSNNLTTNIPFLEWIIVSLYGALFIWTKGATPGKKLLKIKVVTSTYKTVEFGHALLRESIGKTISSLLSYIGYL